MTDLAIAFAWAWGLHDWRTAEALGISENKVRKTRRALGLKKGGQGVPLRDVSEPTAFSSSAGAVNDRTMKKAAAVGTRDGQMTLNGWTL